MARRTVGILLFDGVEVLDFAGPFEVFAVTGEAAPERPFRVVTLAERAGPVTARNGLSVNPDHTLGDAPPLDVLVVPGGRGTRREMRNPAVTGWVAQRAIAAEVVLSVCTGALVLATAGLLDGLDVTTHHLALDELRAAAPPTTRVHAGARFKDNGHIVTSAGISAGIDASLHLVARLVGPQAAAATAAEMEYAWSGE